MTTQLLMKELLENLKKSPQSQKETDDFEIKEDDQKIITYLTRSYLSLDYALLHVVIEGYKDSKIKDPSLDQLLNEEGNLDKLKLLSHSVFHPKNPHKYLENLLNFLETPGSEKWIGEVDRAFSKFFTADPIIGKALAHKSVEATRVYERVDTDPVREFITLANEAMFEVGHSEETVASENITKLKPVRQAKKK